MSFGLDRGEQAQGGGRRHAPAGGALAGRRPFAMAKGLNATVMAPPPYDEPVPSRRECRQVIRVFIASLGIGFALTGAAAWAVATALSTGPTLRAKTPTRPAGIVLANDNSVGAGATNDAPSVRIEPVENRNFDANLPVALASAPSPEDAIPRVAQQSADRMGEAASLQLDLPLTAPTMSVPVPVRPSRTAVYDISAHTVYMPNGQTLEAHSGLGHRLDNPRYVKVKDRGPTPPNTYELTLREKLFHKVRAIRLIPVDDGKMFGRDGMLAHSYMRGASGQSNGCISFKDYPAFLRAYLKGEVDRLVVVTHINSTSWHTASAVLGPQLLDTN